ncbi:MAG: hypothetical protein GY820_18715 [Gammaproteobacteria bacterium]|nr:hypothetical protein [Gammaproteobacteria bacterium]
MPRWKDAIDYWITLSDRPINDNPDSNQSRASDNRGNMHNAMHHPI